MSALGTRYARSIGWLSRTLSWLRSSSACEMDSPRSLAAVPLGRGATDGMTSSSTVCHGLRFVVAPPVPLRISLFGAGLLLLLAFVLASERRGTSTLQRTDARRGADGCRRSCPTPNGMLLVDPAQCGTPCNSTSVQA